MCSPPYFEKVAPVEVQECSPSVGSHVKKQRRSKIERSKQSSALKTERDVMSARDSGRIFCEMMEKELHAPIT
jgi:hypothetical protein